MRDDDDDDDDGLPTGAMCQDGMMVRMTDGTTMMMIGDGAVTGGVGVRATVYGDGRRYARDDDDG